MNFAAVKLALSASAVVFGLDQLTKLWAVNTFALERWYRVDSYLSFYHYEHVKPMPLLPWGLILAALLCLWLWGTVLGKMVAIGIGVYIGGALGNLLDLYLIGSVTDFLVLGPARAQTVNIADISLGAGGMMIAAGIIRSACQA